MKRIVVMLSIVASAVVAIAPATADPGDIGAGTRVDIEAEGFGPGAAGLGDYEELESVATGGIAESSYNYPAPTWVDPGAGFQTCDPGGCSDWSASAHGGVDVAAGIMEAFAQTSIHTGGNDVSNAGFSTVRGLAYIDDTITLSEPATVQLEGSVHVRLAASHSHHGWYGDPEGYLDVDLAFRGENPDDPWGEMPWTEFGGYEEEFQAEVLMACPYPSTCGATEPLPSPGPTEIVQPFSVEVELPAGTSQFNARMLANIEIMVWGAYDDEHRAVHGASALVDGANTLDFVIRVPDHVEASSGSGLLPIVGGASETDTTAPTVECEQPSSDWHAANVALACTAVDDGSGLADAADDSFALTTSVPDGVESADATTDSREVCDAAGNCATAGPVTAIKVDRKVPSVYYEGNAGVYDVGGQVDIRCVAEDLGSGIASHTCEDAVGPAYSFAVGENTLAATAVDGVGNEGAGSASFTIVVTPDGVGDLVRRFVEDRGIERSLLEKLDAAAAARNERARNGQLGAFVNHVRAQSGKALTHEHAEVLERLAGAL